MKSAIYFQWQVPGILGNLRGFLYGSIALFLLVSTTSCRFGNKTVEKKDAVDFPNGYYEIAEVRLNAQPTANFKYCAKLKTSDQEECRDPLPDDPLPSQLISKIFYNPMGIQTSAKDKLALIFNPTLKPQEAERYAIPAFYDGELNLKLDQKSKFPLYHPDIPANQECQAVSFRTVVGKVKKYDPPVDLGSGVSLKGAIRVAQTAGNSFDQGDPVCKKTLHYYRKCYEDVAFCIDANDHDLFVGIFQPYIDAGSFAPHEIDHLEKFGFQVGVQ